MRTFVLRARQASSDPAKLISQIGTEGHTEVIAHVVMNALYRSSALRTDTEIYIVLEAGADFPKTVHCSGALGVSFLGFHETAILSTIANGLASAHNLARDEERTVAPGIAILGYGFERLVKKLIEQGRALYLLESDGVRLEPEHIQKENCVFLLSDHLAMPAKTVSGLERLGVQKVSLGDEVLFASQCVTIIHYLLAFK